MVLFLMKNTDHIFEREAIMRFPERLKDAIGDMSVRAFAQKCGHSESGLRKYLSGETYPPLDRLSAISEAANVPVDWLVSGDKNQQQSERKQKSFEDEFALIPGYKVQVSAGYGSLNSEQEQPTRFLAFRRKWLKFRGFCENDLVVVWAKGDSMEPTIHNNDTLVVHLARTKPIDGHIYIFRNGDELFVKRYQSMLGAWSLISDNSFYRTVDIPKDEQHQFEVVGQVVHISKDIGD